jgi:large subunit ribosomal protein L24
MVKKIKLGDTVKIIAGKDRGKVGKVVQIFHTMDKVVVEKLNMMKRHLKSQRQGEPGQMVEFSAPLHVSNVQLMDPEKNEPTRVGFTFKDDGKKVRVARKSGAMVTSK